MTAFLVFMIVLVLFAIAVAITLTLIQTLLFFEGKRPQSNWFQTLRLMSSSRSLVLLQRQLQIILRRPQSYWLFSLALVLIAAAFAAVYNNLAQYTYNAVTISHVSPQLIAAYRLVTSLGLFLIVPVIGVSAVMSERESGTLDLVLASAAHPLEFVMSKVVSALIAVIVIIVGMAPVLSLVFYIGGVSPQMLIGVVALQVVLTFAALSAGVMLGAAYSNFFVALSLAYALTAMIALPAFTFGLIGGGDSIIGLAFGSFFTVAASLGLLSLVPELLQRETKTLKPVNWRPIPLKGVDTQLWTALGARDFGELISDRANPVFVAERDRFFNAVVRRDWDAPSVLFLSSVFFCIAAMNTGLMLHWLNAVILVFTPMLGASLFSAEHERANWENLRSTLLKTTAIFWGKFKLAAGHGLIHAYAFYIPALLILAIVWCVTLFSNPQGMYAIKPENNLPVWGGAFLALPVIGATVLCVSSLAVMISTFHHKTFTSLLQSYGLAGFFLFGPWYFRLLHPNPDAMTQQAPVSDLYSISLIAWHGPYVFDFWPSVTSDIEQRTSMYAQFWMFYPLHLCILMLLTGLFTAIALHQIHKTGD